MGKKRCPQCGKKFDFELSGWICPECGLVILGSTEEKVFQQEELRKKAEINKRNNKYGFKYYLKKRFFTMLVSVLLIFVITFGIGLSVKIPDLVRKQKDIEKDAVIKSTSAEMGELISIAPYTLEFTRAFAPDWDILPRLDSVYYLAVDYVAAGKDQESVLNNLSDAAWVCLHDIEADSYLAPQSAYQLTGSEVNQTALRQMNVTGELDKKEGTLIYMVQSLGREYELCVFAGSEADGYGRYDISVNEQYTIPLKITEQGTVNGS